MKLPKWKVQIHGEPEKAPFEISVLNTEAEDRCLKGYGWFSEDKLLISHSGGPCPWGVTKMVWDELVIVADLIAKQLNSPQA